MNRNTQVLVSALGTLKDHIRSEVSEEARMAFPSMERIAELTDRYRVANALNSALVSDRDPAYDVLAAKAMAQVDAVRPLVNRGDGRDLTDFEMMTYLVDAAVADFAPRTVKKGVNYLAIDSSLRSCAASAWEHLAEAMDRDPGAVLNPYLMSPAPSVSQYHFGNVFADCEIDKVWDTDGRLFVSGYHHDGRVEVELRQLTDEGERLYAEHADYEGDIFFPEEGVSAMGSTYRDGDESRFIHDLWDSPEMCVTPRYMELCFGAAAQERGSGDRDRAVEAGAPEPPVPVTELDMEDRGDAR